MLDSSKETLQHIPILNKLGKNRKNYTETYMIFCLVFAKYLSELKVFRSNVGRKTITVRSYVQLHFLQLIYFNEVKEKRPKVPEVVHRIYFLSLFTSVSHLPYDIH
jgi:hypothetical protein